MSINLMSAIFRTDFRDLQDEAGNTTKASTAKFVSIALADHANDEGEGAYPSIAKLAYKTNLSRTAVINALDAMKYNGILTAEGTSKWDTVNYTINKGCFSQDSQPALLVNPLDSPQYPQLTPPVSPVDPNHPLTILKPNKDVSLSKEDYEQCNRKSDYILANNDQSKAWAGREMIRADLLEYADWYNLTTGQGMPKRAQKSWWKALSDWKAEGLTVSDLQEAYTARSKWRTVSDPNELTKDAAAIHALPQAAERYIPNKEFGL
jgi:hypothetical protein